MRKTGRITGWYVERGFGFITNEQSGKRFEKYFGHISQWRGLDLPQAGQSVEFEVGTLLEGPCPPALNITPME